MKIPPLARALSEPDGQVLPTGTLPVGTTPKVRVGVEPAHLANAVEVHVREASGLVRVLRASAADGRPYNMPGLILTIGARRVAFARNTGALVFLRGGIDRKDFWQLNPQTEVERQLTALPAGFVIGDFDVSADGTEIIFDRVEESSSLVLIERNGRSVAH